MHLIDLADDGTTWDSEDDLIAWVTGMSDDELQTLELEAEVTGYGAGETGPEGREALDAWVDGLSGAQFSTVMDEAKVYGNAGRSGTGYLDFARELDLVHDRMSRREGTRRAEDAERPARRDEDKLSRSLERIEAGTRLYGQVTADDLSNTMFDDAGFITSAATPAEVLGELRYQLLGEGKPIARQHRQPLPHMSARQLTRIGLKS